MSDGLMVERQSLQSLRQQRKRVFPYLGVAVALQGICDLPIQAFACIHISVSGEKSLPFFKSVAITIASSLKGAITEIPWLGHCNVPVWEPQPYRVIATVMWQQYIILP